jgi:hypothetical protein
MEGAEHLEHIAKLKYVTTDQAGSRIATSQPKIVTRAGMYEFVRDNPDQAYAISQADNVFAFLEHVNGHVQYVRTAPDSTTKDNLLSLPRF